MSPELLHAATGCGLLRAGRYAAPLARAMARHGINTPLRQAAFLGQIAHESGGFSSVEESLTYSALRLTQVWPRRFPTLADASPFANNPRALANKVYGGRMGNTGPDDGWRYRGRGLKQLTGLDNYRAYSRASGTDFVSNPDALTLPENACDSAAWFWSTNSCNPLADRCDWPALTRKINGGTVGLDDRIQRTERAKRALGVV